MASSVLWFRRDLRLRDNPALLDATGDPATRAAKAAGDREVVPLFVIDPRLWGTAGAPRRAWLARSLRALDESVGGALIVRHGDPAIEVRRIAQAAGATSVHVAADFAPYGRRRDTSVESVLSDAGIPLVRTGSPYAVAPGRILRGDGTPYAIYSPFYRAWRGHGWRGPAAPPDRVRWIRPVDSQGIPPEPDLGALTLPSVGEDAALARWSRFRDERLSSYAASRDRPDLDGTSSMSAHLKYGEVHPRTLLADLDGMAEEDAERFRKELAWREFYADVIFHRPDSIREHLKPAIGNLSADEGALADERFAAWASGCTGYPIVDAGMRQLQAVGWMHNRVRMIVASFLVKDLHLDWRRGAKHFMRWLRDGDLASNHQGWQWVAGSGTDPAPYFRIFNPVKQGLDFDPEGDYVRRHVAQLAGVLGAAVHEPWRLPGGVPPGYPQRIVDHATERKESLRRFEAARSRGDR